MADGGWFDKITGLLGSALRGPVGQNVIGGALGAATQGDPYTIDRYWAGIEQQKQHKALRQMAETMGVIKPGEELPPGLTDPAQLAPHRKYDKSGYWEESFGKPPVRVRSGEEPPPKMHGTSEELGEAQSIYFAQNGRMPASDAELLPLMDQARQNIAVRNNANWQARQKPEKPGYDYVDRLGGFVKKPESGSGPEFIPVPGVEPKPTTPAKLPTPRELRARKVLQDAGIQTPTQEQLTNALMQVDAEDAKKKDVPKDLAGSLEGLRGKGLTFRDPITGAQIRSEGKVKTGADAVAQGAIAFNKQDETLFTNREGTADMARQMMTLLPKLTQRDLDTMKKRVKEQPYWSAALGQYVQQLEVDVQSNDSPVLKQYLALMKKIQVEKIRELFPTGRLPVYDQQLFMGKDISPRDTLEVQRSQLETLRSTAIQQMKKMLAPTTTSAFTTPGGEAEAMPQPGEVRDGYRFRGGNPNDQGSWEAVQ